MLINLLLSGVLKTLMLGRMHIRQKVLPVRR